MPGMLSVQKEEQSQLLALVFITMNVNTHY